MRKYLIGFLCGVAIALGGGALAAQQFSAWVMVSCNTDGTLNLETAPPQ